MKKNSLLVLLFTFVFSFSQEYKLGKVTIEELSESEHKLEKDAPACKIFSKAKTYMVYSRDRGFELVTEVENKIKIYKTEGLKYGDFSISYYNNGSEKEVVNISDAVTYNLVNGKIEKSKLKSEGEFTEKKNKYNSVKKITLPNVKVGSVIEYKYTLQSPFLSSVNEWFFQDFIPVNYSSYQIRIPEYFNYNPFFKGTLLLKATKSVNTITQSFTDKERDNTGNITSTSFSESKLSYNENTSTYEIKNIPSIQDERFVKNVYNYISSLSHELASIQYPNQPFKLLSTTWEEVAKNINAAESFGGELDKSSFFEDDINKLLVGKNTVEEKIISIYEFVKNNFKWNGYYGIYTDEGLRSIYKSKTGNIADINLLLTAILRYSKINAHPVLISSVSNGIPTFPSRTAFNYVIAGVELEGKTILLDATDKNALPDILPSRAINWTGRMIYQNGGSKEVDLQPSFLSKDNIILNCTILSDGTIKGNIKRQLTNYNAFNYRSKYGSLANESVIESLEKNYDNIEIENYSTENITNLGQPVIESFDFVSDKSVEIIGDKIFIDPMLFYALESNPFKAEQRAYPVEFPYPYSDRYIIKVNIPDGYLVESLPKNENVIFGDKLLNYKYVVTNDESAINLVVQDDVNTTILSPDLYLDIKDYFQKIVTKQTEKIVLKKK